MKQSPEMNRIEAQMRPGVITHSGFLGDDRRLLIDILAEDDARVKRLGLTHAAIAARMRQLAESGKTGLGLAMRVESHFDVESDSVRGKLPCPFGDRGFFQKGNVRVSNDALGEEVLFTELNIHMIEAHGFYEGIGSPYRQDPEKLALTLEIRPAE